MMRKIESFHKRLVCLVMKGGALMLKSRVSHIIWSKEINRLGDMTTHNGW